MMERRTKQAALFEDPAIGAIERTRLRLMLRAIFGSFLVGALAFIALAPFDPTVRTARLVMVLPLLLLLLLGLLLVSRGALRAASLLIISGLWVLLAAMSILQGGVRAPAFGGLLIVVLLGGLLFGGRAALLLAILSIAFGALNMLAIKAGLLAIPLSNESDAFWLLAYTVYLLVAAQIIGLVMGNVRESLDRARAEIADRRAAEAALRASEAKFAGAFRVTPVGIAITRISDSIVIEANDALLRLVGRSREQVVGRHIDEMQLWVSPAEREEMRARLQREGSVRDAAFTFSRADGSLGAGLISAELVEIDGELCTLGAIFDLSEQLRAVEERRRLEAQMLRAQKLESLGLLAGGIAHDFNNLMSSVMGNAGLALIDTPADSALRPSLLAIDQTARSAADLCRQLLAYAGKSELMVSAVDLAALVRDMAELLRLSIERSASLSLDLQPDLPAVIAEASQIRQVLLNLVTNAAEAIAEGGRGGRICISLRLARFERSALAALDASSDLAPGPYLALEVRDDGCGMDAATQQRIFDPFFTTKPSGHGLGLAAVQGIARQHGGLIAVRSAPGSGTTFTVLLPPAAEQSPAPAPAAPQGQSWGGRGAVLVVDDEDIVRSLAGRIFERHGVTAVEAAGGAAALEILGRPDAQIAAVLLDLTMPGMSGAEVLAAIRARWPALPVLLTSGYSEQAAHELEAAGGPIGFIQKPYRPQELIEQLFALVEPER